MSIGARRLVAAVAIVGLTVGAAWLPLTDGRSARPVVESDAPPVPASPVTQPLDDKRVLVVGDSVLYDAAPAIDAALVAAGARTAVHPMLGLGLTRDAVDWRALWQSRVAEHNPSDVVLMVGAWDLAAPGDDYEPLLREALDVLTANGAVVWLLGLPAMGPPDLGAHVDRFNSTLARVAATRSDTTFVDTAARVSPRGFVTTDTSGASPVRLRKNDGVHLCPEGAERVAASVTEAMDLGGGAIGAWENGPWRTDARYSNPAEGCV